MPFPDTPIEKVRCLWDERELVFRVNSDVLCTKQEAEKDINAVFVDQKRIFLKVTNTFTPNPPVLPLSKDFLQTNFGEGAKQLCSGESFVIQANNLIYKRPFKKKESERLHVLKIMAERPSKSIFSCDLKLFENRFFFRT